LTKFSS